jgi:transcriptional regulator with XRE-family HTH domain
MTGLTQKTDRGNDGAVPTAATLAERIEELRKERGISKNQVNTRCGFSDGYVSRLTSGKSMRENPRRPTLEVLAAALSASFDYLVRGVGPKEAPAVPESWDFSRREVAMRALVGRGIEPDRVAVVVERMIEEMGQSALVQAPATWWLEAIEGEMSSQGYWRELIRGKKGMHLVLGAEPDPLLSRPIPEREYRDPIVIATRDPLRKGAIEILVRKGRTLDRAAAAVATINFEPPRVAGHEAATSERLAKIADAVIDAEDKIDGVGTRPPDAMLLDEPAGRGLAKKSRKKRRKS